MTELAPSTRYGDCRAQHTFVFFIGQALGPVVYGFDLRSAGITPALLAGALVLSIVPSLDERSLYQASNRLTHEGFTNQL